MRTPIEISRSKAANILDEIRILTARYGDDMTLGKRILQILEDEHLPIPTECEGEAHSNGHIDNCALCAPEWGWILQPVKIK